MRQRTAHRFKPGRHRLPLVLAVLAGGLTLPAQMTLAQCTGLRDGDFEQQQTRKVGKPWIAENRAGIDIGRRLSHSGANNAWARRSFGWNAMRQSVRLTAGTDYTLSGWVRTSANVSAGYFGFRGLNQHPVREIRYGFVPGYRQLRVTFRPSQSGRYYVFAGVWALGQDTWIQIDDMALDYRCNDTAGIPASG